ncbi:DUF1624 domain-containing protein [Ectothiorhodospiraceae bacterium BW-2]|nr:DUF1624 domain-containing protein [Ectothiorhodospiraceae bacterium BW-2]
MQTLNSSLYHDSAAKVRYLLPDQLRGLAIVLMALFHLCYDLTLFGYLTIDFQHDTFWYLLPRFIVMLFMFTVGIGLWLAHHRAIRWRAYNYRLLLISANALLISIVTWYAFREQWVYFGTLHSIALCSVLALPFVRWPRLALVLGAGLVIGDWGLGWSLPWWKLPHAAMDYIPPFPWLGFVLMGIAFAAWGGHQYSLNQVGRAGEGLSVIGRHSLLIYMLHQPLLFGSVWLFNRLWG